MMASSQPAPPRAPAGPEPEHPAEPEQHTASETPTASENAEPEIPTEPLLPPHASDEPPHTSAGATPHPERTQGRRPECTQGPHGAPAYGAPGFGRPAQPQNFFDWIRSHGIYRGRDRWIGGVSSGIAHRLGVDPLIIRGIFIVLTLFAGIGVLAYGLGWALLPEPDGRIHVQEAAAGRWTHRHDRRAHHLGHRLPRPGRRLLGLGPRRLRRFFWTVFWVGGAIYLVYYLTQRNKTRNGATRGQHSPGARPAYGYAAAGTPPAAASAGSSAPPFPSSSLAAGGLTPAQPFTVPPTPDAIPSVRLLPPLQPRYGGGVPGAGPRRYPPPFRRPSRARNPGPGAPAVAITAGSALLVGGGIKALDAANVIDLGDPANAVVWASRRSRPGPRHPAGRAAGPDLGCPRVLRRGGPASSAASSARCPTVTGSASRTRTGTPVSIEQARQRLRDHRRPRNCGPDRA